jgi:undecaprenyl-diphosphatase
LNIIFAARNLNTAIKIMSYSNITGTYEIDSHNVSIVYPYTFIVTAGFLYTLLYFLLSTALPLFIPYAVIADKFLTVLLNVDGCQFTDVLMYNISQKYIFIPLTIGLIASLAAAKNSPLTILLFIIILIMTVTLTDQISASYIKPLVGRLRPSHTLGISNLLFYVNGYHGGRFGFVSSHAANTIGVITLITMLFHNRKVQLVLWPFMIVVCYSRIYLGVHFLGDVICGGILGYVIATFCFKATKDCFPNGRLNIKLWPLAVSMIATCAWLLITSAEGIFI